MALFSVSGIDELNAAFGRIGNVPWDVTEEVLGAMAEVAAAKVRAQGEAMGVRDPESNVHILDKIKPVEAKKTDGGGSQDITFSGSRTRINNRTGKKTRTRNAEIAFVNEFGKKNQPARPFVRDGMDRNVDAITDPGIKILGDWIEKEFQG